MKERTLSMHIRQHLQRTVPRHIMASTILVKSLLILRRTCAEYN